MLHKYTNMKDSQDTISTDFEANTDEVISLKICETDQSGSNKSNVKRYCPDFTDGDFMYAD